MASISPESKTPPAWIFVDAGYTLVDETPAFLKRFDAVRRALSGGKAPTAHELLAKYEELIRDGEYDFHGAFAALLKQLGLGDADPRDFPWDYSVVRAYRDAAPALRALHGTVRLGVLANQGKELSSLVAHWGFAGLFDLVLSSGDVGIKKPYPAFFALAAERAGCPPGEILMAGDRLDNDIGPAKRAGWLTAWIRRGSYRNCKPEGPDEKPDFTFPNLLKLAALFVPPERIRLAELTDNSGRILAWPVKERDIRLVLGHLTQRFEAGRDYAEREVNAIIDAKHLFGDYALLRRELVDRGFLERDSAGQRYRRRM